MKSLRLQPFSERKELGVMKPLGCVLIQAVVRPLRAVLSSPLFNGHRLGRFYKRVGLVGMSLRGLHTSL